MSEGGLGVDDGLCLIKHRLLGDTLGEDGGLGDPQLFLEDTFHLNQNLKCQVQLDLSVLRSREN